MEGYTSNQANRSFVTFFLLNARLLLSMRLNFYRKRFLTDGHVEQQKNISFRWTNGLLNVLSFYLQQLVVIIQYFFAQDVDFMDQTDPFVCDCKKEWLG